MSFQVIDDYYRQEHFDFFRPYQNPFYSVTFPLRCTALKEFAQRLQAPTYLSLCYFLTKALQPIEDFRYRLHEGKIVLYDHLDLGLTLAGPGGRFRFGFYPYADDSEVFFQGARQVDETEAQDPSRVGSLLVESDRLNYVFFTALPKVPFTSFTHAVGHRDRAEPQVAFGKFYRDGGDLWVPVGMQINHIFVDGNPLGQLVEAAQALYDEPA